MVIDTVSGTLKKSCQKESQWRLVHSGQDGQTHLAVHLSDTRWVRCSGEVEYYGETAGLMKQLHDLPTGDFVGIQRFPSILLRLITPWCMLIPSEIWEEDALFEHRTRSSRKVFQKDQNGLRKAGPMPGIMVGWQEDVGMCNLTVDEGRQICYPGPGALVRNEGTRILPCTTSQINNYALRTYKVGDQEFMTQFQRVLEKESVDLLLAAFIQATGYGMIFDTG